MIFHTFSSKVKIQPELKLISIEEQKELLLSNGWEVWWNDNNWIHRKTVLDTKIQYYANYGMTLNFAYCFEKLNLSPIPTFLPKTIEQFLRENIQVRELLRILVRERNLT